MQETLEVMKSGTPSALESLGIAPERQVQVVLFDNDGTLVDTFNAILGSMHYALNEVLGHDLSDAEIASKVGIPLIEQMQLFADEPSQVEPLVTKYREHNECDLVHNIGQFAGLQDALQTLKDAGYRMGVVTSKRRHVALAGLEYFGMAPFFEVVNGFEASTAHKPEAEPLLNAAAAMGVPAEHCVYVGDSPFDLQAAHAAGMKSVAVTWGKFFDGISLAKEEPSAIVNDPSQLVAAIKLLG